MTFNRYIPLLIITLMFFNCDEFGNELTTNDGDLIQDISHETQDIIVFTLTIFDNEGNESLVHRVDSLIRFKYSFENLTDDSLPYYHFSGYPELSMSVSLMPARPDSGVTWDIMGGCYSLPPSILGFMPPQTSWECEYSLSSPDAGRFTGALGSLPKGGNVL